MKKALLILLMALTTSTAVAADRTYYSYPDATTLPDAGRILIYDGSASKNITGSKLKSEVLGGDGALIKQAPASATTGAEPQVVVKDKDGIIKMCVTASGTVVIGGGCQ